MTRTPAEKWPPRERPRGDRPSRRGASDDLPRTFENKDLEREIAELQALWPPEDPQLPQPVRNGLADARSSAIDVVMAALAAVPDFSLPAFARQFRAMAREHADLLARLERLELERADLANKLKRADASLAQARWDGRMTEAKLEQLQSVQARVLDLLLRAVSTRT